MLQAEDLGKLDLLDRAQYFPANRPPPTVLAIEPKDRFKDAGDALTSFNAAVAVRSRMEETSLDRRQAAVRRIVGRSSLEYAFVGRVRGLNRYSRRPLIASNPTR